MRYTKEQINERFQMLPASVQDIVLSAEVADAIKEIADKNGLHIDTAGLLNEEITYVMVGAEKSSNFISNLKTKVHLPEDKVNAVAGDVNEKIFLPVREALKVAADKPAQSVESEVVPSSSLHRKEVSLENQINHSQLTESEEIKEQIKTEQEVRPEVPPPANLPVGEEVVKDIEAKDENKERHIEKQSPYAKDPYREPFE
jgi:hypothetical protein